MTAVHTPVLLDECLSLLSPDVSSRKEVLMCDSTTGEGGHTEAFLDRFERLRAVCVDADAFMLGRAKERLACFGGRVSFRHVWFDDFYREYPGDLDRPDVILFDLGISTCHYEMAGRGFSFRKDEALDMRLDESAGESASDIVNGMREEELADLIYKFGGEKFSRRIAKAIAEARLGGCVNSSARLADIIYDAVPAYYQHGAIHPATRTFQALRIAVNGELRRLFDALHDAFNDLREGGKLGVITFHSLEDRIVKNYFRSLGKKCVCPPQATRCECGGEPCAEFLARKPVSPSVEEIGRNPPSRSAHLRAVRKLRDAGDMRKACCAGE